MESSSALKQSLSSYYRRRSLVVALVVGTLLNLINQPEALFTDAPIVWTQLLLTYFVPFAVATYGAYAALRNSDRA